tara:strand:+ start:40 stop:759 length:720 start_codon:yes stop_codon:yes gene_type:complete
MKFICVVPVYNEDKRLQVLLEEINYVKKLHKNLDFVIFDNGSNDNSTKIISNYNIKNFKFKKNYGVGYALISGLKYAINNNYDAVIHLAGNGKMKPSEISKFINKIEIDNFDFVNGSRFLPNGIYSTNPIQRIVLIKILSKLISIIYKKNITDATCGYRAFKVSIFRELIKFVDKKEFYTYKYEYYSIGKALINENIKFSEIPVTMDYTKKNYSKITPIIDWWPIIFGWLQAFFDGKKF